MVYGILGLINFAHGEIVMIGAMISLAVIQAMTGFALPGPVIVLMGLLIAIPACMLLGYGIERVAYRPLRHAPRLAPLITAIGVSIVLQNIAMIIWGRQYIAFPPLLPEDTYTIAGASITLLQIFIFLLAIAIMAGLIFLVQKTRLGRTMRATAQNPEVAGLMGVNVNNVISSTFIIGSALAAVAGLMVSAYYGLAHYYMGFLLGLKAFSAAVLGYIGPLTGGVLGSHYQDVFAFFVLILVLIFRPSGLLGERTSERP